MPIHFIMIYLKTEFYSGPRCRLTRQHRKNEIRMSGNRRRNSEERPDMRFPNRKGKPFLKDMTTNLIEMSIEKNRTKKARASLYKFRASANLKEFFLWELHNVLIPNWEFHI